MQPHIPKEAEPGPDFLHNGCGNHPLIPLQLKGIHKIQSLHHSEAAEFRQPQSSHSDCPGHIRQPVPMTAGAGGGGHTLLQLLAHGVGGCLPVAALQVGDDPLEGLLQNPHAGTPVVGHLQLLPLGAVEDDVLGLLRQGGKGFRQGEMIFLSQGVKIHAKNGICAHAVPAGDLNGPLQNGLGGIGNHQSRVRLQPEAQAGTLRAGAVGGVVREHPRLQLRQADAAVCAGVVLGEVQIPVFPRQVDRHQAPRMGAGSLQRIRQTAAEVRPQHQPVHHQLHRVFFILL